MGSNETTSRRRRVTAALTMTGAIVLAGCSGGDDDATAGLAEPAADEFESRGIADEAAVGTPADEVDGAQIGDASFDIGSIGRDVIVEMRVVLTSDDIERSVASIAADARALGGGIASSDVRFGDAADDGDGDGDGDGEAFAILVVKVPPDSVDRLLAGLDVAGTVASINQSAQDVTEQLVDLDVRISNARRSVANVREFMDRTENLQELVTLEGELTRRQTELERLEAQRRNLGDRVALATVTIEVVPTASVPAPVADEPDTIGGALDRGWDAFTSFLFAIGYVIAVALPFLVVGLVAVVLAWWFSPRRRGAVAATAGGPGGSDDPEPADAAVSDAAVSEDDAASPVG